MLGLMFEYQWPTQICGSHDSTLNRGRGGWRFKHILVKILMCPNTFESDCTSISVRKHTKVCTKTHLVFTHLLLHTFEKYKLCQETLFRWKHTMVCSGTHHAQVWETQLGVLENTPCFVCYETKVWRILYGEYKWYITCHHHVNIVLISVYRRPNMSIQNIELSRRHSNLGVLKILAKYD